MMDFAGCVYDKVKRDCYTFICGASTIFRDYGIEKKRIEV